MKRLETLKMAQSIFKKFTESKGFDRNFKSLKLLSAHEGTCTAEMTVGEEHLNFLGVMHGGCTASLIDVISAIAVQTTISKGKFEPLVTVDLLISFLRKASLGEKIVIEAKSNKIGKNLAFMSIIVENSDEKLIATGSQTFYIMSKEQ